LGRVKRGHQRRKIVGTASVGWYATVVRDGKPEAFSDWAVMLAQK